MSNWLDTVRNALDLATEPARFFFRDDDAGWDDERLFKLLDLFAAFDTPVDLAVIPQSLNARLAGKLCDRIEKQRGRIGIHQHGFAHINHESEGRKCEFGPARRREIQEQDIESGKRLLVKLLGSAVQPIFTPPWNRCLAVTGDCLARLGFRVLSRDRSAEALNIAGLKELPVSVDWFAKRKGERLGPIELGSLIAEAINDKAPVGIMFHHAVMDSGERQAAAELLALLAGHNRAHRCLMQSLALNEAGAESL
jgi:peptidoglycan/xylan/chitin deacetylase (PgdA/CDA1 family)